MKRRSKRLNPDERDCKGRFKKVCGASCHNVIGDDFTGTFINLHSKKRISARDYKTLISKGFITEQTIFICKDCVHHGIADSLVNDNATEKGSEKDNDESEFLENCYEIGKQLGDFIANDISQLYSHNSDVKMIQTLINYEPSRWLSERPHELLHCLSNLCNIDINTAGRSKLIILTKIIELIYYCRNSKLVLPNHLIESLLSYYFTNSKGYANFLGNRAPGGSYTYLMKWLKEQASEPLHFPNGLCKAVFDNNQKVGKTYLITGTNTVPTSVMTSHLWISLDVNNLMQNDSKLRPDKWMWESMDTPDLASKFIQILMSPGEEFRTTRNSFIESCLKIVQKQHNQSQFDDIDFTVQRKKEVSNEKKCITCGCEADITYRVCRSCGGSVIRENVETPQLLLSDQVSPYDSFLNFKSSLPKLVCKTGEPDFINPNSYSTIIQVIQNIGIRAGIKQYGGEREWLFIECDGLPYNTLREILPNVWRCPECKECFFGLDVYEGHKCFILRNVEPFREFGWLVPVSGLLHLEMNLCRAFVKLNWDVFTSDLGKTLGFQSPKAQEYLKKGSDHHKTWHFLEILYSSLSLELLVPYTKNCISQKETPSVTGYWEWCKDVEDPNYIYLQNSVFTQLHALMMLRAGE